MTLAGLTGLGGGQSITSVASKVDQAIESFTITTTGFVQTFTKSRLEGGYYKYYVWTDPGTFEVTAGSRDIDVFVLGGGGAGAPSNPGSGGDVIDDGTIGGRNAEVWRVGGGGGGGGMGGLAGMMGQMMGGGPRPPPQARRPPSPQRPDMDGPDGLDDIIKTMNLDTDKLPDLDNISLVSGDTDRKSGITLNL